MCTMKSRHSVARNIFPICGFICAIFISTVAQGGPSSGYLRSRHIPPGQLIIDRTPNFGWNLAFNLQIDGRPVANIAQGHSYSTWLPAGPHVLTVHKVPTVGYTEPTSTTVNIQPGGSIGSLPCGTQIWFTPATSRSLADPRRVLAKSR